MYVFIQRWWVSILLILSACGTYATPIWHSKTATPQSTTNVGQSILQSMATSTNIPDLPTATIQPTSTPTEEPTITPEPTEEQIVSPIDRLVAISDPENGKTLFNTHQPSIGFACSTCHHIDTEAQLIGPGLLNVQNRAEIRVDGQSPSEYIYNAIRNPNEYIVDGFQANVMPNNWSDVYSDKDIFDIVAYLLTLGGESPVANNTQKTEDVSDGDLPSETSVTLPDTANAENGAELFQTFQADAGFACSTCHHPDSEDRLIGPGLLNVAQRAESRVEGQSAVDYLFTSVVNPSAFVVPEYPDGLMPQNWANIYSDEQIYDIIAYLLTLK